MTHMDRKLSRAAAGPSAPASAHRFWIKSVFKTLAAAKMRVIASTRTRFRGTSGTAASTFVTDSAGPLSDNPHIGAPTGPPIAAHDELPETHGSTDGDLLPGAVHSEPPIGCRQSTQQTLGPESASEAVGASKIALLPNFATVASLKFQIKVHLR